MWAISGELDGSSGCTSLAPSEVEAIERRGLYLRRLRMWTWGGCINRVHNKVSRKRVGTRNEGSRSKAAVCYGEVTMERKKL